MLDQNISYQQFQLEQLYPEQLFPEQLFPEQLFPEQLFPEQLFPEQEFPEQLFPEQLFPEQKLPDAISKFPLNSPPLISPAGLSGKDSHWAFVNVFRNSGSSQARKISSLESSALADAFDPTNPMPNIPTMRVSSFRRCTIKNSPMISSVVQHKFKEDSINANKV